MLPPDQELPEVYVQPGESRLVREPTMLRTLLGSCVGIAFRIPRLGVAALCHPMLPNTPAKMAASLSREDRLRLLVELSSRTANGGSSEPRHSILELRGLGKEIWEGIDAQEYVNNERASWDG